MEDVIAGADDAAGGVEDEFAMGIFFERGENFVECGNLLAKIFGFVLGVSGLVGPTHPGGNAVDGLVATGLENGGEASFDGVVTADRGAAECGKILGPMGFSGAGHTNKRETKRLVRLRPHKEFRILAWSGTVTGE
jgi:hypothetical protein